MDNPWIVIEWGGGVSGCVSLRGADETLTTIWQMKDTPSRVYIKSGTAHLFELDPAQTMRTSLLRLTGKMIYPRVIRHEDTIASSPNKLFEAQGTLEGLYNVMYEHNDTLMKRSLEHIGMKLHDLSFTQEQKEIGGKAVEYELLTTDIRGLANRTEAQTEYLSQRLQHLREVNDRLSCNIEDLGAAIKSFIGRMDRMSDGMAAFQRAHDAGHEDHEKHIMELEKSIDMLSLQVRQLADRYDADTAAAEIDKRLRSMPKYGLK